MPLGRGPVGLSIICRSELADEGRLSVEDVVMLEYCISSRICSLGVRALTGVKLSTGGRCGVWLLRRSASDRGIMTKPGLILVSLACLLGVAGARLFST